MGKRKNIIRRALDAFRGTPAADICTGALPGGKPLKGAMYMAAINRCVRLISESIASMPLRHLAAGVDGVYHTVNDSLTQALSYEPNTTATAFEFVRTAVKELLLRGDVLLLPRRQGGTLQFYMYLSGDFTPNGDYTRYTVNRGEYGQPGGVFEASEVIHLRGYTADGYRAVSVPSMAVNVSDIAFAADNEAKSRIENSGSPRLLVQNDDPVYGAGRAQERNLSEFINDLGEKIRSYSNAISIPGGYKVTTIGASAADMQFQSIREFAVREVCRFFGVPPTFVYCEDSANYKSTEAANTDFLCNTLEPILRSMESELTRKLIPRSAWGKERIEFDRAARLAADSDSRARYYSQMLAAGVYTPNELRRLNGQSPVPGGDAAFISANLRRIDENI